MPSAWRDVVARAEPATSQPRLSPRRILVIAALALAVLIAFFAAQNLASSAVYYLTPTEASQRHIPPHQPARIGGLVLPGTLQYDPQTRALAFALGDGTTNIAVIGSGAPPALLREGAGAVVEGEFAEDGTFRASAVIAKHDEQYAPPSPGKTPAHSTP
jgi:cytochrome c-type biogenesis protein CcmE